MEVRRSEGKIRNGKKYEKLGMFEKTVVQLEADFHVAF